MLYKILKKENNEIMEKEQKDYLEKVENILQSTLLEGIDESKLEKFLEQYILAYEGLKLTSQQEETYRTNLKKLNLELTK